MYSATNIFGFDVDEGEKVLKAQKVQDNLENISRETKTLGESIQKNSTLLEQVNKESDDNRQSFRKLYLDLS